MESNDDVSLQIMLFQASMAMLLGALYLKKVNSPRNRRWWVHPLNQRRIMQGDFHNLLQEMRFLATGDSIPTLAWSYRIGKSTCCQVINETTRVIWDALHEIYLPVPTQDDYKRIASEFNHLWNVPNCIGAIDGKHVAINAPPNSGSQFINYKKFFGVVLLAVCDAQYSFTHVDVGAYGSQSDVGIFKQSEFGKRLNSDLLPLPPATPFPQSEYPMPYYFVGDEAFPLKKNLMRPFPRSALLELKNKVFNYRLSRGRRVIENTFGILVARWRIFHRKINAKPENVDNIIKATVCLHNFLQSSEMNSTNKVYCPPTYVDREVNGQIEDGEWRRNVPTEDGALGHLRAIRLGARNGAMVPLETRNKIADYFLSPVGSIDRQINYVLRGLDE